jgi:hypothetical protein
VELVRCFALLSPCALHLVIIFAMDEETVARKFSPAPRSTSERQADAAMHRISFSQRAETSERMPEAWTLLVLDEYPKHSDPRT